MANNIEWSHTDSRPALVDPDGYTGEAGLGVGEVGVWLGSDGANILYGSKDSVIEWARELLRIVKDAVPVPDPDDSTLVALLNKDMYGKGWSEEEGIDWDEPEVHRSAVWEPLLNCSIEEYAAASPWMIVMVVDDDEAESLGYDWQDDSIGAMR